MSLRGRLGAIGRKALLLRLVGDWLDVFRGVNKVYYEISMDQLASDARRVTPPKGTSETTHGDPRPPKADES